MVELLRLAQKHNYNDENGQGLSSKRKNILPCVKDRKVAIYYHNS